MTTITYLRALAILTAMAAATLVSVSMLAARPAPAATTFTVNRTTDQPDANLSDNVCDTNLSLFRNQCTLRAAIQEANDTAGTDTIRFAIGGPAGEVRTISPTSELPSITQPVTIDGYTQSGASENTATDGTTNAVLLIELNGGNMPAGIEGNGFTITGGGTTIRGLVINRFKQEDVADFDGNGIFLPNLAPNTNNVIEGNFIGTDATGTQDLGNEESGVLAFNQSTGNRIGGPDADDRNLISGNGRDGVGADSSENTIQNNLIGTDEEGTADLGNGGNGVEISGSGNLVTKNHVAFNGKDGFSDAVEVFSGTGNSILNNAIFSNAGLGINLVGGSENASGATANDPPPDSDTGPNNLQNKPVLTSATNSSTKTTIKGKLNSTPNTTFKVQFFSNPSGNQGKKFVGSKNVTTGADGKVSFTKAINPAIPARQAVTATATDPASNTSEFSDSVQVS